MKSARLIKIFLILIGGLFAQEQLTAQPGGRGGVAENTTATQNWFSGNTHVLIVGISDYDTYKDLNFADDDAMAFYNYLIEAHNIDKKNIRLLTNEKATHGNVGMEIMKIGQRIKKGIIKPKDNLVIYFAGHGDCDGEEAYWLCHNAPNGEDKNLYRYSGGTIRMSDVKRDISTFTKDHNLNVLLITDACRTNEVPGGKEGLKGFQNLVMEKRAGEIQLTSCSVNQQAQEDKRWGGGRGVFSFYLVNGLSGQADKNGDQQITLRELKSFIEDSVIAETQGKQTPDICCSENLTTTIATVNKDLMAKLGSKSNEPLTASSANGRGNPEMISDSVMENLYKEFKYSISQNKTLRTSGENTNYASDVIHTADGKTNSILLDDMKYELCGILIDELQTDINKIVRNEKSTIDYQLNEAKAAYILGLVDSNYIFYKEVDYMRVLFGQYKIKSNNPETVRDYLKTLEQKEKEFPSSALLHFQKGYWLMETGKILEATRAYNKSIELAPKFAMAYNNLANLYWRTKRPQLAEKTYVKMLQQQPKSSIMYGNYAYFLYEWDKDRFRDAESMFKKAISMEPASGQIHNNYALLLMQPALNNRMANSKAKRYAEAEKQLQKALELNPENELFYFNYGVLLLRKKQPKNAIKFFQKAKQLNPNFRDADKMIYQIRSNTIDYGDSY